MVKPDHETICTPAMNLELSAEEVDCLTRLVRKALDEDRFPLSPRLRPLRSILGKLDPSPAPDVVLSVAARYPVPARKRKSQMRLL